MSTASIAYFFGRYAFRTNAIFCLAALLYHNAMDEEKAIAIAEKAYENSQRAIDMCIRTEERAKSLQHRIDSQDMKMNAILYDLRDIKHAISESKSTQHSIKKQISIFLGLVSVVSAVGGIIKVIFMIMDRM